MQTPSDKNTTYSIKEIEEIKKQLKITFGYISIKEDTQNGVEVMTTIEIKLKHKQKL